MEENKKFEERADEKLGGADLDEELRGKSLNEKIAELDKRVEWFYADEFKLEEATEKYRAAAELAKEIEKDLANLKNEIEILTEDFSK